jgi:3-hydroxyisobutyrate dehydrogenase
LIEAIKNGAAASFSLNVYGPRILNGDFNPGFYVHHFVKDMAIVV